MASHSAKKLFDRNLGSSHDLLKLYDGISNLGTRLDVSWLLRSVIVFSVAALDTYFHDKVRYRAGQLGLQDMPPALAKFSICMSELPKWDAAQRKGNVIRNWVTDYLAKRPLQRKQDIAEALKLVGIQDLWSTIEPDNHARQKLFDALDAYVDRRNKIAHEGDRETSRRSGKKLRKIDRGYARDCVDFIADLVGRIETAFPK